MIRSLLRAGMAVLLLGAASSAAAYFPEDFLIERDTPAAATGTVVDVAPVVLPVPDAPLSRALFTARVIEERYPPSVIAACYWDIASSVPPRFTNVFADVPTDHPYARHLCIALRDGFIRGYGDGTFRPDQPVTAAEAARILARSEGLTPWADAAHYDLWFEPYLWALSQRNALPQDITDIGAPLATRVAEEMTVRVTQDITDRPTRTYHQLVRPPVPSLRVAPLRTAPPAGETEAIIEDAVLQPEIIDPAEALPSSKESFWDFF